MRAHFRIWRGGLAALLISMISSHPAHSATVREGGVGQPFTIVIGSAYARRLPSSDSEPVFSVFQGQTYRADGQSPDGQWVLIQNWQQLPGWVRGSFGAWGDSVPPAAVSTGRVPVVPAGVLPQVSAKARAVYQYGLALGNNPRAFAKVGDCNSENGRFLVMFDAPGEYRLGARYAYLQNTIHHFAGSFRRTSLAAHSGFSPASVLDPLWANPQPCQPGEGPLQCEYRLHRPSLALIALGTHGGRSLEDFEVNLRRVIEESMRLGVVPILTTKADDVEGQGRINAIIRRLAVEYEMPLWDFWAAAQPLPNDGLASDGIHLTYGRPMFDDPWAMQHGWPWRNLTALLGLEVVWRGVSAPPEALRGSPHR
jgi:hypothetical protein